MPTTLTDAATLAQNATFRSRVTAALVYQARQVIADPGEVPEFSLEFARAVARQPTGFVESAVWAVVSDPDLPLVPTDQQIIAALQESWGVLAGLR